jgi:hypothetical protein
MDKLLVFYGFDRVLNDEGIPDTREPETAFRTGGRDQFSRTTVRRAARAWVAGRAEAGERKTLRSAAIGSRQRGGRAAGGAFCGEYWCAFRVF